MPDQLDPRDPQPPDDLGEALALLALEWGPSDPQDRRAWLPTITDAQGVTPDGERWLRAAAARAAAGDLHPRVVTGVCDEGGQHVALLLTPEVYCQVSAWNQVHPKTDDHHKHG